MAPVTCRWGILGPGVIAHKFTDAVLRTPGNAVVAAASHTRGKAAAFAGRYEGIRPYDSYAALLADPAVDAVYVANLHNLHLDAVMQALQAGKPVLCEKPMAVNARQVQAMIDCAQAQGVFLMEAMWTRFLPVTRAVRRRIADGDLGDVGMVRGAFTNAVAYDPASRLYSLDMTGGSLLDLGVYMLAYLLTMLGDPPEALHSTATLSPSGVDDLFAADLRFPGDRLASIVCGMRVDIPGEMCFYGTQGSISVPRFWDADHFLLRKDGITERVDLPYENGFVYEVEAVSRCIAQGLTECPDWPLSGTLAVAEAMDALRAQWGLVYPGE